MRAFIYTGGNIIKEKIPESPLKEDLVIAADSGYQNALTMGVQPQILLGDLDSLDQSIKVPKEVEIIQVPAEKDLTDTQLAVSLALERGATELVLIGGLGGRLDHTLSNLAILEELNQKHIRALFNNGKNRARFLRNDSFLLLRDRFRYFSLIAADEKVKGVTVEGCKYPLEKAKLSRYHQYAVSNEIVGNCAYIEVRRGGLWIIESNDQ